MKYIPQQIQQKLAKYTIDDIRLTYFLLLRKWNFYFYNCENLSLPPVNINFILINFSNGHLIFADAQLKIVQWIIIKLLMNVYQFHVTWFDCNNFSSIFFLSSHALKTGKYYCMEIMHEVSLHQLSIDIISPPPSLLLPLLLYNNI